MIPECPICLNPKFVVYKGITNTRDDPTYYGKSRFAKKFVCSGCGKIIWREMTLEEKQEWNG